MSSKMDHLANAFRLAHRASEDAEMPSAARHLFRAIAHEIWMAHGKDATRPTNQTEGD